MAVHEDWRSNGAALRVIGGTPDEARALTLVDMFAGAGGLSSGLAAAGFTPLYANEVVPRYAETYRLNHPHVLVDAADVREVSAAEVRSRLGLGVGELDLLAGGPPCQGFSINAPARNSQARLISWWVITVLIPAKVSSRYRCPCKLS